MLGAFKICFSAGHGLKGIVSDVANHVVVEAGDLRFLNSRICCNRPSVQMLDQPRNEPDNNDAEHGNDERILQALHVGIPWHFLYFFPLLHGQ